VLFPVFGISLLTIALAGQLKSILGRYKARTKYIHSANDNQ